MITEKLKQLQEINYRLLVVSLALAYGIHLEEDEHVKLMDEWSNLNAQRMELDAGEVSE